MDAPEYTRLQSGENFAAHKTSELFRFQSSPEGWIRRLERYGTLLIREPKNEQKNES